MLRAPYRVVALEADVIHLLVVRNHLRLCLLRLHVHVQYISGTTDSPQNRGMRCFQRVQLRRTSHLNIPNGARCVDATRSNDAAEMLLLQRHTARQQTHFESTGFQSNDVRGAQNLTSALLFYKSIVNAHNEIPSGDAGTPILMREAHDPERGYRREMREGTSAYGV